MHICMYILDVLSIEEKSDSFSKQVHNEVYHDTADLVPLLHLNNSIGANQNSNLRTVTICYPPRHL